MNYTTITPAGAEPVTLDELKLALRLDGNVLDTELAMLLQSAREVAEHQTGLFLMPQVVRTTLTDWPADLVLDRGPVRSVAGVTYWDGATWATAPTTYVLSQEGTQWRLDPATAWPSLGDMRGARVRLDLAVGYADAASVPAAVKRFIIAQVGAWLRHAEAAGPLDLKVSPFLAGLLDTVRIYA